MSKKLNGVLRRMMPVASGGIRRLLTSYLDETQKESYESPEDAVARIGEENYAEAAASGLAPRRPGIEYVPHPGNKIHVFGPILEKLSAYFPDPNNAPQAELVERLVQIWTDEVEDYKKKGIHAVFSIHPSSSKAITNRGGSMDPPLLSALSNTMEKYAARFYPGDAISWVAGVHHDRPHDHVHVVIFPTTGKGRPINFSSMAPIRSGEGKGHRIDFQGMAKLLFWEECRAIDRALLSEVDLDPELIERARGEIVIATAAINALANPKSRPTTQEFEQKYREMEALPPSKLNVYREAIEASKNDPNAHALIPGTLRALGAMKAELRARIARNQERAKAIAEARAQAIKPLYEYNGADGRMGYSPEALAMDEKEAAAVARLQADRCQKYRAAVAKAGTPDPEAPSLNATILRTSFTLSRGAAIIGAARKESPEFARDPHKILYGTLEDVRRRFDQRFAEILARHQYSLRPFSMQEFGDRPLAPYQMKRDGIRENVDMAVGSESGELKDPFLDPGPPTELRPPEADEPDRPGISR
jgi:hypothetical protein